MAKFHGLGECPKTPTVISEMSRNGYFPRVAVSVSVNVHYDHSISGIFAGVGLASSLSRLSKALLSPIWGSLMPGFVDATISLRP